MSVRCQRQDARTPVGAAVPLQQSEVCARECATVARDSDEQNVNTDAMMMMAMIHSRGVAKGAN